jgi:hypothetical protein
MILEEAFLRWMERFRQGGRAAGGYVEQTKFLHE